MNSIEELQELESAWQRKEYDYALQKADQLTEHADTSFLHELADLLERCSLSDCGDDRAEQAAVSECKIRKRTYADDMSEQIYATCKLGTWYKEKRLFENSLDCYQQSLSNARVQPNRDYRLMRDIYVYIAELLRDTGDDVGAIENYHHAISAYENSTIRDVVDIRYLWGEISAICLQMGDVINSEVALENRIELAKTTKGISASDDILDLKKLAELRDRNKNS